MRGGGDEYPMLIVADQPPAAVHRQRLGDDETARAAAEFDDHRRAELLDRIDDMREEARVGFPAAEMRQRIVGKVEAAQQCGLIGLAPAPQRAQQPRQLDRAEGDDLQPLAERKGGVWGKSVSVRVGIRGRRRTKKKKNTKIR